MSTTPTPSSSPAPAGHRFPVAGPTSIPAAPSGRKFAAAGPADPWIEPSVRALRRGQPPPARWTERVRREPRFWGYLALAAVLAALVPVTTAVGIIVAESAVFRVLVACAIPVVAGLAVVAAARASADAAPQARRP